ncbi:Hypothetical Protein FCC1311_067882 [Hondaea fermentalgiana]|uniref:Uncharacterized protein n=1 Tax=Hondaea fermentalgiana TaxID=2315210 RepID=A0A2R5GLE8_9STRA|nr:Hypothetical Protein FCC1311_067882 [Hondaea fermentalgiana]|eukprot:GBG30568.1 Hypothetical Protein FCC1311_067882 [Hondaea fermentalgiana]
MLTVGGSAGPQNGRREQKQQDNQHQHQDHGPEASEIARSKENAAHGPAHGPAQQQNHHHHETPRHELPVYAPPAARYKWGVSRENRHVSASQLFFDLPFVGVSFRTGSLLGEDIGWENLLIFLATILLLYGAWFSRLALDATLRFDDNFHRLVLVAQTLLIALAAHQLTEEAHLRNYEHGQALGFTACLLAYHLLQLGIWVEIWAAKQKEANVRAYARICALMECVPISFLLLALILILKQCPLIAVAMLWLAAYLVGRAAWQLLSLCDGLSESNSIPWDAGFCIVRFGRFTMLMMGEGVLQIIIFTGLDRNALVPELSVSWFALFFLSYLMMGVLQLLHYTSMPFAEQDHVLLRGPRILAVIWIELFAFYSCALISCGVALKKILYLQTKLFPDLFNVTDHEALQYETAKYSQKRRAYFWFLAASLGAATFLLAVQQLLQVDALQELGIRIVSLKAPGMRVRPPRLRPARAQDLETGGGGIAAGTPRVAPKRVKGARTSFSRTIGARTRSSSLSKIMTPRRRLRFGYGQEKKRVWLVRLFAVPMSFLALGAAQADPVFVVLCADGLLLALLVLDIVRGRFRRRRKLNRTMTVVIAVGKLKYRVKKRREQRARQALLRQVEALRQSDSHMSLGDNDEDIDGTRVASDAGVGETPPCEERGSLGPDSDGSRKGLETQAPQFKRETFLKQIRMFMRDKAFYRPFLPRLDWTHLHTAHEMKWQNLFYDLIVVALAYRLNHMNFEYLLNFEVYTLGLFVLEASAVLDCWNKHNLLQATFISGDVLHRLVNIFQFGLVAFLASAVPVREHLAMTHPRFVTYMYLFTTAKLLFELIVVAQLIEIWFTFRNNVRARGSVKHFALMSIINIVLLLASYVAIALGANVLLPVTLWGLGHYLSFGLEILRALIGKTDLESSLPSDLGFLAHRESELGLIMIGEGILSSINASLTQSLKHYVNFVLGFGVVASTKLDYFFIQRFNPPEMAARKSHLRGAVVTWFLPIFMVALSAVGGITVFTYVEDASLAASVADEFGFRALPTSMAMALLCAFDFLHEGASAELETFRAFPKSASAVYVAKFVLIAFPWVVIAADVNSTATLGLFFTCLVLLFAVHAEHVKLRARVSILDDIYSHRSVTSSLRGNPDMESRPLEDFTEDTCDVVIHERSGRDFALG